MEISDTIKKYRKKLNLTQEQVAASLGVSAPAVNKWEKGISYPDISLLAPLARLLSVNIDTLLSFHEELSEMEISQFITGLSENMMTLGFDESFTNAENMIQKFPNCHKLILAVAQILNGYLVMRIQNVKDENKYKEKIISWFEKVSQSEDLELSKLANVSLSHNLIIDEKYDEAQKILDKIPTVGFDKRIYQIQLFVAKEEYDNASVVLDEMLYQQTNAVSNTIMHIITMLCKQSKYDDALFYAKLLCDMADEFDLGKYMGDSAYFTIYADMKDKEQTLDYLEKTLNELDTIAMARDSRLYRYMKFKEDSGLAQMKEMIIKSFDNDNTLDFIKEEPRYKKLMAQLS